MKKIFVNLKDWFNLEENKSFVSNIEGTGLIVFPALPYLYLYKDAHGIEVGTQSISAYEAGAHTGKVSALHLKDFGVKWAILNHRECIKQNVPILKSKIEMCLQNDINIIICIEEFNDEAKSLFTSLLPSKITNSSIYIALEPKTDLLVFEINTQINDMKDYLSKNSFNVGLIYGGNINKENFPIYKDELNVDGFLISRSALNQDELKAIINFIK